MVVQLITKTELFSGLAKAAIVKVTDANGRQTAQQNKMLSEKLFYCK
jgi:hypothetical protein